MKHLLRAAALFTLALPFFACAAPPDDGAQDPVEEAEPETTATSEDALNPAQTCRVSYFGYTRDGSPAGACIGMYRRPANSSRFSACIRATGQAREKCKGNLPGAVRYESGACVCQ